MDGIQKQLEEQFQIIINSPKKPVLSEEDLPQWNKDLLAIVSEPFTKDYLEQNGIKLEDKSEIDTYSPEEEFEFEDENQIKEFIQQNKELEQEKESISILSSPLEFLRKARQIVQMEQENESIEDNLQLLEDEFLAMFIEA